MASSTSGRRMRLALFPSLTTFLSNMDTLTEIDAIIFPELVDGGYRALSRGEGIHDPGDPFLDHFRNASRDLSCLCVAGSVALRTTTSRTTNTSLVYQRGRLIHRYDKIHLFRPTGDPRYFAAGQAFGTFPIAGTAPRLRAGVIVCYDLRFPELTRVLAGAGSAVLFVPARWPSARDEAWRTLLRARAIENQIFTVGCNARGSEGGFSYAFDPLGRVVFSSRIRPGDPYYVVELDLTVLAESKKLHDNLAEARLFRAMVIPRRLTGARPVKSGSRK
jgi:omega-amidase